MVDSTFATGIPPKDIGGWLGNVFVGEDDFNSLLTYFRVEFHFPLVCPGFDFIKVTGKGQMCLLYIFYFNKKRCIISK